jgi:hypothetical protein
MYGNVPGCVNVIRNRVTDDGWPKAEWAVTKALELDDQLAEAHLDLAALKMVYYLDWVGTERESKRVIELSPRFDEIHRWAMTGGRSMKPQIGGMVDAPDMQCNLVIEALEIAWYRRIPGEKLG